jgi:hypothetical protein
MSPCCWSSIGGAESLIISFNQGLYVDHGSSIDRLNWTDMHTTWIYCQDFHAVKPYRVRTIW